MRVFRALLGILVVLLSLCIAGCLKDKEKIEYRTTAVPVNQYDRVVISDVTWKWTEASEGSTNTRLTVQGKIKNTSPIIVKNVQIEMKAYDSSGTLIKSSSTGVTPYNLPANTQVSWEIYVYCPKPDSVSIGYSYSAEISVPAQKLIF